MSARLQARRPASDFDLIASAGSLPLQPGISVLGQDLTVVTDSFSASSLTMHLQTVIQQSPVAVDHHHRAISAARRHRAESSSPNCKISALFPVAIVVRILSMRGARRG